MPLTITNEGQSMVNVDRNPESKYSGIQLFADGAKNGICAISYNSTVTCYPSALRRHTQRLEDCGL